MIRRGCRTGQVPSRQEVVRRLKETVGKIPVPIDAVYLYGSYAHGSPNPSSDVDVAVVSPAFGRDVVAEAVMLMEAFEDTGLIVEPWPYSREEFTAAGPGSFLYEEVIKKGIPVVP